MEEMKTNRVQVLKDIYRRNRYALDERFIIRDGNKHKCAVICPGGGYSVVCSFVEGVPFAKELNKHGISAVIVYYRVRKKAAYPNPQDDLARAVKELIDRQEELQLDMTSYSVWGSSAGGHLAGSFGTERMGYAKYGLPKPGMLVLTYPVIALEAGLTHQGTRNNLLGKAATEEDAREKSIHTNVTAEYPPTFIWCGDADKTVPPENTAFMRAALEAKGVPHCCRVYSGVDHGVGLGCGTQAESWHEEAISFWNSLPG